MNYPLDPKIVRFYQEMGFTEPQIRKAHDYSQRTGADILDTLNNLQNVQQPPPPPQRQQNNYLQQQPNTNNNLANTSMSFLTPMSKIKVSDYEVIFSRSSKHMHSSSKVQLRQADYPVGLLNVSNCCYLNSLLQCYFLMNSFKIAILTAQPLPNMEKALENQSKTKVKRIKSEYQLLAKLKWFFTRMSLTSKKYLDPTTVLQNLVDSVGQKVSYGQEKDLSEINILIIERLSEGLTYSKNHYQIQHQNLIGFQSAQNDKQIKRQPYNSIFNPREGSIKKLFYGTKAEYYENSQIQQQAPIVSDFTGLILNPRAGSLYKALDDELNFEVEINGGIYKKVAYIRDEPEYLFLYINRTEYDKEEGQTLKNRHKFNFDFTIYLDRYLQKYREKHTVANQKIRELLASKQKLMTQLNNLHLLYKKIQECHKYAQQLQGWSQKLPTEQEFDDEFANLEQKLQLIQDELNEIESRKEQYHLMYIFVHRGDAVSGHYWGYGRNDASWYKFDINTKKIQQDQIIIDLQKSAATPYALLYVKQQNLPKFDYRVWNEHLLLKEQNFSATDFRYYLEPKLSLQTITENQQLYNEFQLRTYKAIKNKASSQYINRFNIIKKLGKKYNQQRIKNRYLDRVDLTNNFSLFLWSKGQQQLCKFSLFQQSLLSASNNKLTVQKLMNDTSYLQKIQKKFRSQCKGEYYLKSYALLPKQVDKYVKLTQQFQLSAYETIWSVVILNEADNFIEEWNKQKLKFKEIPVPIQEHMRTRIIRLLKWIKIRQVLVRSQPYRQGLQLLGQPLWISLMNRQIAAMILFQIEVLGIKLSSLQSYMNLSDTIGNQLAWINAGNSVQIDEQSLKILTKQTSIDLVNKFNENQANKANQSKSLNSKTTSQKRVSKQQGEASPSKSNAMVKQTILKEKRNEERLTVTPKPILILQNKQCWKLEELQKCQLNYDFNSRLIQFLKKIGIIRQLYQRILKGGKNLSINQLKQQGLILNRVEKPQPPKQQQESLI